MLLLIIKCYRLFFKRFVRNACLYEPSCSYHVESQYKLHGWFNGWRALTKRYHDCRPGYYFISIDGKALLVTKKGNSYKKSELSPSLQLEMESSLKQK